MTRTESRREFLQLAQVYEQDKHNVNGWFYSNKLDGMRAFWDGGITRGLYTDTIPFANTVKDHIRLQRPVATGLWSRYGKPIQAPMWFLDELPKYPLDGELYCGLGNFQETMSTVRKLTPVDSEWEKVNYIVFNLPDYSQVFKDGTINVPQWTTTFKDVVGWLKTQARINWTEPKLRRFETVVHLLEKFHPHNELRSIVRSAHQVQLPFQTAKTQEAVYAALADVVSEGGEGLILVNSNAIWEPKRTNNCLKVKPRNDAEGIVTGYIWGRETDRGSKLLGMMGAIILDFNGKRLELSGFTDAERQMTFFPFPDQRTMDQIGQIAMHESRDMAGKQVSRDWVNTKFLIGSKITFTYRELTNDGLPKEAAYLRARVDES